MPPQPTRLIGRDAELRAIRSRIGDPDVRLVTLTGPAGVGKTRLAIAAVAGLEGRIPNVVYFVDLSPIADPELVLPTIARTLGIREATGRSPLGRVSRGVQEWPALLLLLDNFEQVLGAAPLVGDLLSACPTLKIVITSRAPLNLRWEFEHPVPPLGLPAAQGPTTAAMIRRIPAAALFVERAQAVRPDFRLDEFNAPTVARICRHLDGIPLAIELAAARVRALSPPAILKRLERPLDLLISSAPDRPARHRTLRDAIASSYDLLRRDEQVLLHRLAVFAGGFTVEAVAAVCAFDMASDALNLLLALAEQSLLRQTGGAADDARFAMLETIREFALERLEASGESDAIRRRHAEYFRKLAELAEPELEGANQAVWFDRFDTELENIRAALEWSLPVNDSPSGASVEEGLRLAGALRWFWSMRGYLSEGRRWLDRALALSRDREPSVCVKALNVAGFLARTQGDYRSAAAYHRQALRRARSGGDSRGAALALGLLGDVTRALGDRKRAARLLQESLRRFCALGDCWGIAYARGRLGLIAADAGDDNEAAMLLGEALTDWRRAADLSGVGACLVGLGLVECRRGDPARAESLLAEALAVFGRLGTQRGRAHALSGLALIARARGDGRRAEQLLRESLALCHELGDLGELARVLAYLGLVTQDRRDHRAGVRLLAGAALLRRRLGAALAVADERDQERALAAAHAALGVESFGDVWAEAEGVDLDSLVECLLARSSHGVSVIVESGSSLPETQLTRREREVAGLIGCGLTSRQIAERLVISERTADTHAEHIRTKLGLRSRLQIAAWAQRQGLVGPRDD